MSRGKAVLIAVLCVILAVLVFWPGGWGKGDSSPKAEPLASATSTSSASEPSSESPTPFGESVASPSASSRAKCANQDAITEQLDFWKVFESSYAYVQDGSSIDFSLLKNEPRDVKHGFSGALLTDDDAVGLFAMNTEEKRAHAGNRHLSMPINPKTFYPVQFKKSVTFSGTYIWDNGKAKFVDTVMKAKADDIWWFYVDQATCQVIPQNTIHANGMIGVVTVHH